LSSAFPRLLLAAAAAALLLASPAAARELRACADPNNLPFSNEHGEGFENRILEILARDLDAKLSYTWWAQRRGFVRNTLRTGLCDVVPGTVAGMEMLRTTRPYYRSGYVFVARADRGLPSLTFDDPLLREMTIGVQLIGDDGVNAPPAHALADRGLARNLRGYTVYGDYSQPNPPARIVDAVAAGEVDLAVVWGPLAGWAARRQPVRLSLWPVSPQAHGPRLPMVFDIAMGVRREDRDFARELDSALVRNRGAIDAVLAEYGVPRLEAAR
jgi:mxaJ protein